MDYPDLQQRFAVLNEVKLPEDSDVAIRRILNEQIAAHRGKSRRAGRRGRRFAATVWTASAAAVAIAAVGGVVYAMRHESSSSPAPSTTVSQPNLSTNIHYSEQDLANIRHSAQSLGIQPYLPYHGPSADSFKPSVQQANAVPQLELDFNGFWVRETATPEQLPSDTNETQLVALRDGTTAYYSHFLTQGNQPMSFLSLKVGGTYITILSPELGHPLSKDELVDIANSLKSLK